MFYFLQRSNPFLRFLRDFAIYCSNYNVHICHLCKLFLKTFPTQKLIILYFTLFHTSKTTRLISHSFSPRYYLSVTLRCFLIIGNLTQYLFLFSHNACRTCIQQLFQVNVQWNNFRVTVSILKPDFHVCYLSSRIFRLNLPTCLS